jgi:hypothetical protein
MQQGQLVYHQSWQELYGELKKIRWVVHHARPTTDTKVIEQYLARYICRIGITNKRLQYDKNGANVRIQYKDYRQHKNGQAVPKAFKNLSPLVAIDQILQHQLPPYFQKSRHYGLHAASVYKKYQDQFPEKVKCNGATVRTIIQILKQLLQQEPYRCPTCANPNFEEELILPDRFFLSAWNIGQPRSPPQYKDRQQDWIRLKSNN